MLMGEGSGRSPASPVGCFSPVDYERSWCRPSFSFFFFFFFFFPFRFSVVLSNWPIETLATIMLIPLCVRVCVRATQPGLCF